jgi:N-acetyl-anhydromuramyl-L-alanine amidase AmpD
MLFGSLGWMTMQSVVGCSGGGSAIAPGEFGSASPRYPASASAERFVTLIGFTGSANQLEPAVPSRDWKYIVVHHTATETGDLATIDADHQRRTDSSGRPWLGIGYHFLIGNGHGMTDGQVEPTFRWREQLQGAHAGEPVYNDRGIGICLVGNFEDRPPTQRQMAALRALVDWLSERYTLAPERILRHSDLKATRCPGAHFPWNELVGDTEPRRPGDTGPRRVSDSAERTLGEASELQAALAAP